MGLKGAGPELRGRNCGPGLNLSGLGNDRIIACSIIHRLTIIYCRESCFVANINFDIKTTLNILNSDVAIN